MYLTASKSQPPKASHWVGDDVGIVVNDDGSEVFTVIAIVIAWCESGGKAVD